MCIHDYIIVGHMELIYIIREWTYLVRDMVHFDIKLFSGDSNHFQTTTTNNER